jgi:hypothetical protein
MRQKVKATCVHSKKKSKSLSLATKCVRYLSFKKKKSPTCQVTGKERW